MDKIGHLERNLDRHLRWIEAADKRTSLVLPLSTAMLGVLAVLAPDFKKWGVLAAIATSLATLSLISSLVFCGLAAFPRTKGPKGSRIYFGGINSVELDHFRSGIEIMDEKTLQDDLTTQCHINAQIADQKFGWMKKAMAAVFIAGLPWFIAVFSLYSEG